MEGAAETLPNSRSGSRMARIVRRRSCSWSIASTIESVVMYGSILGDGQLCNLCSRKVVSQLRDCRFKMCSAALCKMRVTPVHRNSKSTLSEQHCVSQSVLAKDLGTSPVIISAAPRLQFGSAGNVRSRLHQFTAWCMSSVPRFASMPNGQNNNLFSIEMVERDICALPKVHYPLAELRKHIFNGPTDLRMFA